MMNTAIQITMSRVQNYGSLFQTYALQRVIDSIPGWHCLTLDYSAYPPKSSTRHSPLRKLLDIYLYWRYMRRRDKGFSDFRKNRIAFTRDYPTAQSIRDDPPRADVYITGADQTFNPNCIGRDGTWFLDFVPHQWRKQVRKISYASSFAVSKLPPGFETIYRPWLEDYDELSLREQSGVDLIRKMLNRRAALCCDPTLLLPADDWRQLANQAKWKIRKPYILVYNLAYMVNPYPQADELEREIQRRLKLPVVYLSGRKQDAFKRDSKLVREATPEEFLYLFFNASFIITTSFHGTVFAMQAQKPFIALAERDPKKDTRLSALLRRCRAEKHIKSVPLRDVEIKQNLDAYVVTDDEISAFRDFADESRKWLLNELGKMEDTK